MKVTQFKLPLGLRWLLVTGLYKKNYLLMFK